MMKRHEVQVLRRAGVTQEQVAKLTGISVRSVRMIEAEEPVAAPDDAAEREKRGIGRPSKAEPFRGFVAKLLAEDPELLSLEVLRRARLDGYQGGKSALYALISSLRPRPTRPLVRFEGLPGEFAQHDFGHVDVRFMDGTTRRIHFFASRLKYSRWVEVTVVPTSASRRWSAGWSITSSGSVACRSSPCSTARRRWRCTGRRTAR